MRNLPHGFDIYLVSVKTMRKTVQPCTATMTSYLSPPKTQNTFFIGHHRVKISKIKNVLLTGYNKLIVKLQNLNFYDLFRQIRLLLTKKSNDSKSYRIVKLVVIGPKICENSHSYFQNWFLDLLSKVTNKS